jgi:hypothetical protein
MQRAWRLPAALWIAILVAVTAYAAYESVTYYPQHWSMDLYHPWGVPLAHESLGHATNPYADTVRYGAFLDGVARASPSTALHWVREFWEWRSPHGIEPTGTPFYYASQAFAPASFDRAHLLYTLADFAGAIAAVFLLARLRGAPLLPALCIVALTIGTFNPFIQDVRAGNINSVQLLVLAVMIAVSQQRLWERHAWVDRAYLAALAVFLVFKPNTLFIVAGLAAHYFVVRGARRFGTGAAIAVAASIAAATYAAWYFGSAGVWIDWLRYTQGANGGTLVYPLVKGNTALPVMLSERAGAYGTAGYSMLLAAAFAVALAACASSLGREPARVVPALRAWLADPWIAASLGALAMFVASPLLWPHYFMFALIPIAWLARPERPRDAAVACAVLSFVLFSRMALGPLVMAGMGRLAYSVMFFSWVPLLPVAFARLARVAAAARS